MMMSVSDSVHLSSLHWNHSLPLIEQPAYIPQVEAISPTLPNEDSRAELSPFKATKDELYQNINRIEREIQEAETQIAKLRRKQVCFHLFPS
jgi:hypothetical protein